MDTRPSSRRRPFKPLVDLSELQSERLPLLEITFGELHQIVQPLTLMVAAHRLVQRPPHQFHRVALGRPRRKRMQTDATPGVLHVFLRPLARVACVVVRRQVQLLVAAVGPAQLVEQPYEQLVVPALPDHPVQTPCGEVQSPADPHFAIGPRGAKRLLFAYAHPAEAHLGVGLQLGLVLEKGARLLPRHSPDILQPGALLFDVLLGVFVGPDGTRPPPAEAEPVERAAHRLPAYQDGGPLPEQLEGDELAAPAKLASAASRGRWANPPRPNARGARSLFFRAAAPGLDPCGRRRPPFPHHQSELRPRRGWCANRRARGRSRWASDPPKRAG